MSETDEVIEETNYITFRECLSSLIIKQLATPATKPIKRKSTGNSARKSAKGQGVNNVESPSQSRISENAVNSEDLTDFVDYIAAEIFPSLPEDLRSLDYAAVRNDATLAARYEEPVPVSTLETLAALIPPSTLDSLISYGLLRSSPVTIDVASATEVTLALLPFIRPLITAYTAAATHPPPSATPATSRSTQRSCEICERDWTPLTYHHLIPRSVHAKVVKRGWHEEWRLDSVAWLCRACHSFVHSLASNEELAREWWSVELLMEREDVRKWADWVGRIRWKAR